MKQKFLAFLLSASMVITAPLSAFAANDPAQAPAFAKLTEEVQDFDDETFIPFDDEAFFDEELSEDTFEEETSEKNLAEDTASEDETEIEIENDNDDVILDDDEGMSLTGACVNPNYAGQVTEEDLLSVRSSSDDGLLFEASFTSDTTAIANSLKSSILNRVTTTTIYYSGNFAWNQSEIESQLNDWLYSKACAHTGVGNEGDYLNWSILGYSWKANRSGSVIDGYQNTYTITFTYAANTAQENEATVETTRVLNSFSFSSNMSDYQKIRAIHDWMTSTITYDTAGNASGSSLCHSAYAAVCKHSCVCQGYALLFYRMCLTSGIDARIVAGYGNGSKHGWNIVKLNGRYYYIDATWDTNSSPYNYFLTGSERFGRSHSFDQSMNPTIDINAYAISTTDYEEYWNNSRNNKYIYFNANGGTGAPPTQILDLYTSGYLSMTVPVKTVAVGFNATGGACSNPNRTVNFIFQNWNTKENGTGTSYDPGSFYSGRLNLTLYAQWKPGTIDDLPHTSRTGYTFQGWYTEKTGGTKYTTSSPVSKNMTLYAQWKPNNYTVTFDVNGGKGGPGTKSIAYGTNLASLAAPTLDYATFQGWYTEKTGGTKITTYNLTKGTTLYAHYERSGIQNFVYRLYNKCLDRNPDLVGFEYWCTKLKNKTITGKACAHGFVFSNEFISRYTKNEDFVEHLYKALLGRGSDPTGKVYWLNKLKNGETREAIFNGFADSTEFNRICTSYGIKTN